MWRRFRDWRERRWAAHLRGTWVPCVAMLAAVGAVMAVAPAQAAPTASTSLRECFGHAGVQLGRADAFECQWKDADEGGTLYWQRNDGDYAWDLHPDGGSLEVLAFTARITTTNTSNRHYAFGAFIVTGGGLCAVIGSGYDRRPHYCQLAGEAPVRMPAAWQHSYGDFAEVMGEGNGIPDCAWEPTGTPAGKTC